MQRRKFLAATGLATVGSITASTVLMVGPNQANGQAPTINKNLTEGSNPRTWWLQQLQKLVDPVWKNLAAGKLRANMPVEVRPGNPMNRKSVSHLEAIGRSLMGLAPWLGADLSSAISIDQPANAELESEIRQQASWRALVIKGLTQMTDPKSKDHMAMEGDNQLLVDAAFICYALLQPGVWEAIFQKLPEANRDQLVDGWLMTRKIKPYNNNWLLFSAMVELGLERAGEVRQDNVLSTAISKHNEWYKGDGIYGDGPSLHADYYNSYVIHPFLNMVLARYGSGNEPLVKDQKDRSSRYAMIQYRQIMPDGSFPIIGRSICYRSGAFHHLASVAFADSLPKDMPALSVRAALTATITKTLGPANYSADGWLLLGLNGHQPTLAEDYISTGSLYLASAAFMPLGLLPTHPFWAPMTLGSPQPAAMPNAFWADPTLVPPMDKAIYN